VPWTIVRVTQFHSFVLVPSEPAPVSGQHPLTPPSWAGAVVDGYRAAWNAPQGDRVLGQVTFSEWLRARGAGPVLRSW
jgi:hypothetical protein